MRMKPRKIIFSVMCLLPRSSDGHRRPGSHGREQTVKSGRDVKIMRTRLTELSRIISGTPTYPWKNPDGENGPPLGLSCCSHDGRIERKNDFLDFWLFAYTLIILSMGIIIHFPNLVSPAIRGSKSNSRNNVANMLKR